MPIGTITDPLVTSTVKKKNKEMIALQITSIYLTYDNKYSISILHYKEIIVANIKHILLHQISVLNAASQFAMNAEL